MTVESFPEYRPQPGIPMRVLVIEDDRETASFLQKALKESGHAADLAGDGETGLELARSGPYDVLIVDRMLPRLDGLSVVRELRGTGDRTPVLILSALGEVDDRVKGLRAGGDDYLTKPYAYSELLARIEALSRRGAPEEHETRYTVGDLVLDRLSHRVLGPASRSRCSRANTAFSNIDEAQGAGGDAHHAARERVGLPLRPSDQCHQRPRLAAALQDRQRLRAAAAAHRARRRYMIRDGDGPA